METRAELKFKHGIMVKFLQDKKMTIKTLASLADINEAAVGRLVRFKGKLNKENQEKLLKAMKVLKSDICKDDIFPDDLSKAIEVFNENRIVTKDIDLSKAIPVSNIAGYIAGPESDPDINIKQMDDKKIINKVLNIVSDKEKEVIKIWYGLDGKDRTLKEIGEHFNLHHSRIRQIKIKALRKMMRSPDGRKIYDELIKEG